MRSCIEATAEELGGPSAVGEQKADTVEVIRMDV